LIEMSTVTDPIADLLARVRNGAQAQKPEMFVPYSKIKSPITRSIPTPRIRGLKSQTNW